MMPPTLVDKNVISVYISDDKIETDSLKMAFCMITKNPITQYQGLITQVTPGNTPKGPRVVYRGDKKRNLFYSFTLGRDDKSHSDTASLFAPIYDISGKVIEYKYCMNCQNKLFYTKGDIAYDFSGGSIIEKREIIKCTNPACPASWEFLGTVQSLPRTMIKDG